MRKKAHAPEPEEDVTATWLTENPAELPAECEEETRSLGMDPEDPESRAVLRGLLEADPGLFGDWDRFQ